ncbi:hypothetical protein Q7C36_023474 [Tachysurus vachellii]|uniref:Uncharacterized protein n=1 Tax=Tachysurus vachellii TaxID=175792 RepID=A0AA88IK06_TACVA|nr:hypothetical protein Q7C36_023474 [Tachysurus vachellii]
MNNQHSNSQVLTNNNLQILLCQPIAGHTHTHTLSFTHAITHYGQFSRDANQPTMHVPFCVWFLSRFLSHIISGSFFLTTIVTGLPIRDRCKSLKCWDHQLVNWGLDVEAPVAVLGFFWAKYRVHSSTQNNLFSTVQIHFGSHSFFKRQLLCSCSNPVAGGKHLQKGPVRVQRSVKQTGGHTDA